MFIKNLTARRLVIFRPHPHQPRVIEPFKQCAMVSIAYESPPDLDRIPGMEVFHTAWGYVKNLPDPEPDTIIVVPAFVASRIFDRPDVFSPGRHVYGSGPNNRRQVLGCRGLRSTADVPMDTPPPEEDYASPESYGLDDLRAHEPRSDSNWKEPGAAPAVDLPRLVRPLREGETSLNPTDGHTDVRNDGDKCFGHPGIVWCETCGAVYGSPEWKKQCEPHCT